MENIERKIDLDIEDFNSRKQPKKNASGVRVTKQMLLESANCDKLSEI